MRSVLIECWPDVCAMGSQYLPSICHAGVRRSRCWATQGRPRLRVQPAVPECISCV